MDPTPDKLLPPLPVPPSAVESSPEPQAPQPPARRDAWRIALAVVTLVISAVAIEFLTADPRLEALSTRWMVSVSPWIATLASLSIVAAVLLAVLPSMGLRVGASRERRVDGVTWICLIVASGLGAGMIHWSVAEPLLHLQSPLPPLDDSAASRERATEALATTALHWGLHYWAITALWTLAMARFGHPDSASIDAPSAQTHWTRNFAHGLVLAIALLAQIAAAVVAARHLAVPLDGALSVLGLNPGLINSTMIDGEFRQELTSEGLTLIALVTLGIAALLCIAGPRTGLRLLGLTVVASIGVFLVLVFNRSELSDNISFIGDGAATFLTDRVMSVVGARTLADSSWYGLWTGYYAFWWFALAPVTALFIVSISRGRLARTMVLGTLIAGGASSLTFTVVMSGSALLRELRNSDLASDVMLDLPASAITMTSLLFDENHWLSPSIAVASLGMLLLLAKLTSSLHAVGWWSHRSTQFPRAMVIGAWAAVILLCIMLLGSAERLRTVETLVVLVTPVTVIALLVGLVRFVIVLLTARPPAEQNVTE